MKLFILALFSLLLVVSSESYNLVIKTIRDQKSDNSEFFQKFLRPINDGISERFKGAEYRNYNNEKEDYLWNKLTPIELGRPLYNDANNWEYFKNLRGLGENFVRDGDNEPKIWDYSTNVGGLGRHPLSYAENEDPNLWGYFRNSGEQNEHYRNKEGKPRNMGHGNKDPNVLLEPEHIGYLGNVNLNRGFKERFHFRLIGRRGLGFDKRTATNFGLKAPITPYLLGVVRRKDDYRKKYYQNYQPEHATD